VVGDYKLVYDKKMKMLKNLQINKIKLIIVVFAITTYSFGQEIKGKIDKLSETEIQNLIKEANNQGYSIEDLKKINNSPAGSNVKTKKSNSKNINAAIPKSNFGNLNRNVKAINQTQKSNKLKIFGAAFFSNPSVSFNPQLNLATPDNYQLGPGDQITIEIWGSSSQTYQKTVSTDGKISIANVSPIFISGLTIEDAKAKIKRNLSSIYNQLNSTLEEEKAYLDLSLSKARSIVVNIIGQVQNPGTYTLNGFSSPLNAL